MDTKILLVSFYFLCTLAQAQENLAASEVTTSKTSSTSIVIYVAGASISLLFLAATTVFGLKYFRGEKLAQTDIENDEENTSSSFDYSSEAMREHYPNVSDACIMLDLESLAESSTGALSPQNDDMRRISISEIMEKDLAEEQKIKSLQRRLVSCGYLDDTANLEDEECEEFEFDGEGRSHRKKLSVVFAKDTSYSPRVSILENSPKVHKLKVVDKEDLVL